MEIAILVLYGIGLLLIFLYSLVQLSLLLNYIKARKKLKNAPQEDIDFDASTAPLVTVQLPLYNEKYVTERLLDNIAKLEYPLEKLEIQVLDDSTDESVESTARQVEQLRQTGLDIQHITRTDRTGFKAGALKEGMKIAKGEFIAIFDADFMPQTNWLKQTIPHFTHDNIGVVQTRWGHLNRNYSLLTKIQAFALDFHFTLEQVGRYSGDHFINFNGTAGVWRKSCIEDAGNWQGDTLTEDLDLSYRAQMKDWKFKYLEHVETPAELPIAISAARSQQFRWNKGAAENFQKLYPQMIRKKNISAKTKLHSFFHLLNSSMFIMILLISVLSVPVLFIKAHNPEYAPFIYGLGVFAFSTVIFFFCYWVAYARIHGRSVKSFFLFLASFFTFFSVAMGFSVHNTIAVLEGHLGKKSEFIRTPKFNINALNKSWKKNVYLKKKLSFTSIVEALLFGYFGFALYSAFNMQEFGLVIFHAMLFIGFGFVFFTSVMELTNAE